MDNNTQTTTDSSDSIDDVKIESYNEDTVDSSDDALTPLDRIKKLKTELKTLQKEKAEYLDGWQRAKADFANYKKREEDGKKEFMTFARESVVTDLLPVLESFSMAFANKDAWNNVDANWRKGVEYIHTQLTRILEDQGLHIFNPIGERFDPNQHASVASVETSDEEKQQKIAEVVSIGYKFNDHVIKAPNVKVYIPPPATPENNEAVN